MNDKKYEINFCEGALLPNIFKFVIPLMMSTIFQLLFNAIDIIVVGKFSGEQSEIALAAVGASSYIVTLLIGIFMGISAGIIVVVARDYRFGREEEVHKTLHTAVVLAIGMGILLTIIGLIFSRSIMEWLETPDNVMPYALLYIRIYFLGITASTIYNFCAAVLQGVGDTRRPFYFLLTSGVANVALKVLVLYLGVAGVAIATVISQILSAILIVRCLMKSSACYQLKWKCLHFYKEKCRAIAKIGIPACIQSILLNVSNLLIQSSVNAMGDIVIAGNTIASNLGHFILKPLSTFGTAALTITSQNYGARNYKRILKAVWICLGLTAIIGIVMGQGVNWGSKWLLRIYSNDASVIEYGAIRLSIVGVSYYLSSMGEVMNGCLRGLQYPKLSMIISLLGNCGIRVLWTLTVFAKYESIQVLYYSFPVSWITMVLLYLICLMIVLKRETGKRSSSAC